MASPDVDSHWPCETFCGTFNMQLEETDPANVLHVLKKPTSSVSISYNIPKPPPLPAKTCPRTKYPQKLANSSAASNQVRDSWDKVFKEGHGVDVHIITQCNSYIPAHYSVLSIASPVLGTFLHKSKPKHRIRYLKIPGVPYEAVYTFIRFLYSSCYEKDEMKKYGLHLLVLSHSYSVPLLKQVCINFLEKDWLIKENLIDLLQLARKCDAPRLCFVCVRVLVKDFKTIASTEGWKVMKRSSPELEQELLESVLEADSGT